MKTKNLFLLAALIAGLNLIPAGRASAQTLATLHSFTAVINNSDFWYDLPTNSDGAYPNSLILSANTLCGTAGFGGWWGEGAVFVVNTDGTGFTNLHSFAPIDYHGSYVPPTDSEGINPNGLVLSGNTLYGTAGSGGTLGPWPDYPGNGTVFALNRNGTGFKNLHSFVGSDGSHSYAGFILSANTLYGTTAAGGSSGNGTVFAIGTNGTGLTNLHGFTLAHTNSVGVSTNSDGASPYSGLVLSGNTLYGTASSGGSAGNGTVFAVNTNGTGFTNLHSFTGSSDGANPQAGLILSGNTLYGTAYSGGSAGNGTVFAVNTNGTGFTNLHSFTATHTNSFGVSTNSDGAGPYAGLILSGSTLYGTAYSGGCAGNGTVFAITTNGTGFTNLHNFTANNDGAHPQAGLILSGNTLYGTTVHGGSAGNGTVFSLSFAPQLTITPSGTKIILSWPTNVTGFDYTGYTLQSTASLVSSAVWSTNSPAPVVLAGQKTVTNLITGTRQFYRLVQ